jgi:hypothetical protein
MPGGALVPVPPLVCAFYGQACSPSICCCGGTSCVNMNDLPRTDVDAACVCFSPE